MKRVALMCQNMTVGGIQRLIVDEANELTRRGIEVWLIIFEPINPEDTLAGELRIPSDHLIYIPYARMRNMRSFLQTIRTLRDIKPDILFTHHWFANTVGRLAAFCAGVRSIAFEHSVYDSQKSSKQFFLDWLLQFVSSRVVAVSSSVRDSLVAHGIQSVRIVVIPNGIDLTRYAPAPAEHAPRPFTFMFVGRLIRDKGVDVLLDALAQVPQVALRIVGDGPEATALKKQTERLGLTVRVHFLGERTDVPELLRTADALVLPSRREGFGMVIVEARASGLPVVLSDFPASTELIENDVQGIIVPRDDPAALAEALERLASDPELYRRMALAAPLGLERFSIVRQVDAVLSLAEGANLC